MDNTRKIILDLCGGTGAWSRPYREAGYTVELITLPRFNLLEAEISNSKHNPKITFHDHKQSWHDEYLIFPEDVAGILAAPPCTEFSVAKGARPRDLESGMEVVKACLEIIWFCRMHGNLKFWAIENPCGLLRQFIGKPPFTFEHWQFGDNQIKKTDIWGYFNAPAPTVKERPIEMTHEFPNGRGNGRGWARPEVPEEYLKYVNQFHGDARRAAARAITPEGFAQAFYKANK